MTGLGSSCGACKFLRRRCTTECVFAPYFCYDEAADHFAAVHKVFGASNVSKLLLHLPLQNRSHAAITMSYEALARMRDPVYGCVSQIFALQQQVAYLQEEIETLGSQMVHFVTSHSHNTFSELQSFSQQDVVDAHYLQNLQELPHLPLVGSETGNQTDVFHNQMDMQMPPLHEWEEANLFGGDQSKSSDHLERCLQGMDIQDKLGSHNINPCLDTASATWDLY